jgi:EAL domain-containing protein (putative c-di-GMP-specific phosphodiesterase class I)
VVGLDDFGIGLSSFANLKHLPVRYIRIDGALIRRMGTDRYAESLVQGIAKAAEILGIFTIAEHIESAEQADRLTQLDISFGQGFHLGKPSSFEDLLQT